MFATGPSSAEQRAASQRGVKKKAAEMMATKPRGVVRANRGLLLDTAARTAKSGPLSLCRIRSALPEKLKADHFHRSLPSLFWGVTWSCRYRLQKCLTSKDLRKQLDVNRSSRKIKNGSALLNC